MRQYHDLLSTILSTGNDRGDRTGTGTRSCFGLQFRHNLEDGFPLLTTKKLPWKAIVVELLWFLRGDTNIRYLLENGVHIWSADAYRMYKRQTNTFHHHVGWEAATLEEFEKGILNNPEFAAKWGDLGPIYGKQWREWKGVHGGFEHTTDQIKDVIESIRKDPEGRRHIVTAWNPTHLSEVALPACHCLFQFYVHDGRLSCHLYQRSADVFLGVPFNIASYALLTHIIGHHVGYKVGELIVSFGDVHIYNNHVEQVMEQLQRPLRPLPFLEIKLNELAGIDEYVISDFTLVGYNPHPAIQAPLSVGV